MGQSASNEESLREAPLLPGLAPSRSEDRDAETVGRRGAAASAGGPDAARPDTPAVEVSPASTAPPAAVPGPQEGTMAEPVSPCGTRGEDAGGAAAHAASATRADAPPAAAREASSDRAPAGLAPADRGAPAAPASAGFSDGLFPPLQGLPLPAGRAATKKTANPAAPPPDHVEHRRRLRARFMQGGAEAMPDYELLELVLFRAIPRRDVKPLAKRLLRDFGGFDEVISAPSARLAEVQGVGDAVVQELKIVEAAAQRLARARVLGRDAMQSWEQLVDYCRTRIAREPVEQFRVLYLDRKNLLIADEAQGRGTVDHVPVYPREVVRRALELQASALILAHNHPSGDPTPSQADVEMTRRIVEACRSVSILVHDHVVVGRDRVASFHDLGLLDG